MDEEWFSGFQKLSLAGAPEFLGRRASLGLSEKRLSSNSAPESHPVSPASSEREAASPPPRQGSELCGTPAGHPASPATSHFSIPAAYHPGSEVQGLGALTPFPAAPEGATDVAAAAAAEERVTLNFFVQEDPHAVQAISLQAEVASLKLCMGQLQAQLEEAGRQAQHDEEAAAAVAASEARAAADATASLAAASPAETVRLMVTVVEEAPMPQQQAMEQGTGAEGGGSGGAGDAVSLAQQLLRVEAGREELGRQAGQLRGRIAKLEGAVLAGESRVKAQAGEVEALKGRCKQLEQELKAAQALVGITPDRTRAEGRRLAEQAAEAAAASKEAAARAARLAAVLAFESSSRQELAEFAALEYQLVTKSEAEAAAAAVQWRTDAEAAAEQLAAMRRRLVDTDAALMQRDDEVKQLQGELEAAQSSTGAAAALAAEWRHKAEQFDRDRLAAAANIRKAERELELVAQDNERMFRQLNFVRTRLMGQLGCLDPAVPDIGKLARELQSWCDREAVSRRK